MCWEYEARKGRDRNTGSMAVFSVAVSVVFIFGLTSGQIPGAWNVTTVHFVSSCHLDVGFAGTAANIVNRSTSDQLCGVVDCSLVASRLFV